MAAPDFAVTTVGTLMVRAGQRCSNPDCGILTAGPHTVDDKRTVIGEAAHIFGARPSDRRFRQEMTDTERAQITNGIWLCSNCHTTIDKDPQRFPAELLFAWKQAHEKNILEAVGTAGDKIRNQVADKELEQFSNLPTVAQFLIRDKPSYWQYVLSAELLDHYTKKPLRKARDLRLGRLVRRMSSLAPNEYGTWFREKTREIGIAAKAVAGLIEDIQTAWGEPETPGNAEEINHVCNSWGSVAQFFVDVAEDVKFTSVPEGCEDISDLLITGALHPLDRFPDVPAFIRGVFEDKSPKGLFEFHMDVELPDGWDEQMSEAIERAYHYFQ